MLASVLIEYSVKTLNKVFDYVIPESIIKDIKIGNKVLVPFNNRDVEGFVLKIHNEFDKSIDYKSISSIVESYFYLDEELLTLGKKMSISLVCNLISCYQAMLPRALKASSKTNINKKYETIVKIKDGFDIDSYIENHSRNKGQISILEELRNGEQKKSMFSPSIKKLISDGIIIEEKREVNRIYNYEEVKNKKIILTDEQNNACDEILNSNDSTYLLYGVTGSGKTEVYINLIKNILNNEKTSIVLVPEISLTPQIVSRFKSVFGDKIAVFHSALSEGEKYDEYRRIVKDDIKVVVGARSAIFTPLKNIGLIIIDECQSSTYKQENNPKYNAINIAIERCKYHGAKLILGSATPSLEQFIRAEKGIYKLVTLKSRISNKFPTIELVDMEKESKKHNYIISSKLDLEIKERLAKNEQIIILLNRRGFSTFISCTSCGYVYNCPNCDISLIYHKSSDSFSCHYCGYRTNKSDECPKCHEKALRDLGLGTEKLEKIIKEKYNCSVLRMDADTTTRKYAHQTLINEFSSKKYQVLVGTQMISKGLNFENVSLVGIINADASLSIPDFRSSERTYELLSQTAGRVGRFNLPGKVLIQTYNMDNYVYSSVIDNNYESFYNKEIKIREDLKYPPFYNICNIEIISEDYEIAGKSANKIKRYLESVLDSSYIILGPAMAGIFRVKNKYHFIIMIKYKKSNNLIKILNDINNNFSNKEVNIDINVNI